MQTTTFQAAQTAIQQEKLVLLYLSMPNCSVCHAVKPRVATLFHDADFPVLHLDAADYPEVAGTFQVMTAPAILVFFQGKEVHRQARFIDFRKLVTTIEDYQAFDSTLSYEELFNKKDSSSK